MPNSQDATQEQNSGTTEHKLEIHESDSENKNPIDEIFKLTEQNQVAQIRCLLLLDKHIEKVESQNYEGDLKRKIKNDISALGKK